MDGFFTSLSEYETKRPVSDLPKCGLCRLSKTCIHPKMKAFGEGKKKMLVVAEAPGADEDKIGRPLVGKTGKYTKQIFEELGINLSRDCIRTNALICRPPDNKIPKKEENNWLNACRPNLIKTINKAEPNIIILMGRIPVKSLMSTIWKETVGELHPWLGWTIPSIEYNAWICPTYHPSFILRTNSEVAEKLFISHLKQAFKLAKSKPFKEIPNYKKQIQILGMDGDDETYHVLKTLYEPSKEKYITFDFETNCLLPEKTKARIDCCSINFNGEDTVAFPLTKKVKPILKEIITGPNPKIACNIKFEDKWSRVKLGVRVRNWKWDVMLAAHILDNRKGTTSLKFQALVQLGISSYNDVVENYLKNKKDGYNRIDEIDWNTLLLYCGLDSHFEYLVAMKQMEQMKQLKKEQR